MSAQFHLAQRGGIIISGDYSGEHLPPSGKHGITSRGEVWLNSTPVKVWTAADGWSTPSDASNVDALKEANVGYRTAFADAVAAARSRAPAAVAPVPGANPPAPDMPFYQQKWFLPAVGVSAVVVVLGVVLWPRKAA